MFGYIRPLRGEMKVRDFELFKASYCGLCDEMRRRAGFAARFIINYDFTFLALLISEKNITEFSYARCISSPFLKKCRICCDESFAKSADYSVILTYWKLDDEVEDGGFFRSLGARMLKLLLGRAYKKAKKAAPEFDGLVRDRLGELRRLEAENCPSLDETADCFAKILQSAAEASTGSRRRILAQLLYHVGRTIYLLDAADDLEKDLENDRYNPLRYRFSLEGGKMTPEASETLRATLIHSQNLICSSFDLLPKTPYTDVLDNIIFLGIPWVSSQVLTGNWRTVGGSRKYPLESE